MLLRASAPPADVTFQLLRAADDMLRGLNSFASRARSLFGYMACAHAPSLLHVADIGMADGTEIHADLGVAPSARVAQQQLCPARKMLQLAVHLLQLDK